MSKDNYQPVDYTQKVLEVKNLKKYFFVGSGKSRLTIPAVDNVSFDVHKREVFGLVGESGCGKTTTGRTIIKLYKPTDGTVDLEGKRITAGHFGHIENIKKIKEETKEKLLEFYPHKKAQYELDQQLEVDLYLLGTELEALKKQEKLEIIKAKEPKQKYDDYVYNAKNEYNLAKEKIRFDYNQEHQAELDKTKNLALEEYKLRLNICKNTFKRKKEGLLDSAALTKEVIEQRIAELTAEHEKELEDLKKKHEELILAEDKTRKTKQEIKPRLIELKEKRNKDLNDISVEYEQKIKDAPSYDSEVIKENVLNIKLSYKDKKNAILEEMKAKKETTRNQKREIRVQAAAEKSQLSDEQKAQIKEIKNESRELIKLERKKIAQAKAINRSKESLHHSRKMQMIFQDPIASLNPRMTVKEIVGEGLIIQRKYSKEEIDEKVGDALETVGLSREFASRYPHEFSGGQRQRIGIARALIMEPSFIIADEPISALDVSIRAQVINLLTELKDELGLTILFIAHDLSVVRFFCDRIAVMYYGKVVELAPSEDLFANPMHPYTISLLSAIPQPDPEFEKGRKRINYDPSQHDYRINKPTFREIGEGHFVLANDEEFKIMQEKYQSIKQTAKKEEKITKNKAKPTKKGEVKK